MSLKSILTNGVADVLGSRAALPLATAMTKAGLRGLGVNISYEFDKSGEAWLLNKLFARLGNPTCLDVGANVGDFTTCTLKLGAAAVVAFEPVPTTFAALSKAVDGDRRATLVQSAVGAATGQVDIFVPEDSVDSVLASLDPALVPGGDHRGIKAISVPLTSLDACEFTKGRRFDILKIDVEGFELEVLRGAQHMLESNPPKVVQFEFNSHHAHRHQTLRDFASLMPRHRFHRLAASSLRPLDVDHYLSTIYTFQNIVGVLDEDAHLIA